MKKKNRWGEGARDRVTIEVSVETPAMRQVVAAQRRRPRTP
jgi:hypothetical protein